MREFFLTDHVMCLLFNHATSLKQIQGYFFILRMHQDRDTRQHIMLEPLTVISSSLPYASSQRLVCWSFGLASGVEKTFAIFPSMISAPILDLPDLWRYHFSMPSQGATQRHTSLAVARRRLGHLGKIHLDSLKHCWH